MDTFIDKLAQKKNAQEMIRANSAAEAAKMDQMQKQVKEYDELMQEIRRVNLRTVENVETIRRLLTQCMEKVALFQKEDKPQDSAEEQVEAVRNLLVEQLEAIKELLEERLAQTEDVVHKENVKVYRNVQAAFTDELEKQNPQEGQPRTEQGKKPSSRLGIAILIGVIIDILLNLLPLMS